MEKPVWKFLFFVLIGIILVAGIVFSAWKFWPMSSSSISTPSENLSDTPYSFLAVHFEIDPRDKGAADRWQNMVTMVDLANQHNIKLTIMFWPGSVEYALSSSTRLAQVKQWQAEGHEIDLHDQGCLGEVSADFGMDGQGNPLLCDNPAGCRKETDMAKYVELVSPYQLKSGTSVCGVIGLHDWARAFPDSYKYEGRGRQEGRNSVAHYVSDQGKELLALNMKAGYANGTTQKIAQYDTLNKYEVYGFANHGEGDTGDNGGSKELKEWLNFLSQKDPEGKKRMTMSAIMENYILPNHLDIKQNQITPANSGACYKMVSTSTKNATVLNIITVTNGDTGLFNFGRCLRTQTFCAYNPSECIGANYVPTSCVVTNIGEYEPVEYCAGTGKTGASVTTKPAVNTKTPVTTTKGSKCGDGICDGAAGEKVTCPADCHI